MQRLFSRRIRSCRHQKPTRKPKSGIALAWFRSSAERSKRPELNAADRRLIGVSKGLPFGCKVRRRPYVSVPRRRRTPLRRRTRHTKGHRKRVESNGRPLPKKPMKLCFGCAVGAVGAFLEAPAIEDGDGAAARVNETDAFQQVDGTGDARPPNAQHD